MYNTQDIIIYIALALAVWFLVRKFFWKKTKSQKSCGKDHGCGCS